MRKKILIVLSLMLFLGLAIYGGVEYLKKRAIASVKDRIITSSVSDSFIVSDVIIDPEKVAITLWNLLSDGLVKVSVEDMIIKIKTVNGEGDLSVGRLQLRYPSLSFKMPELCDLSEVNFKYGDNALVVESETGRLHFDPCMPLDPKIHPGNLHMSDIKLGFRPTKSSKLSSEVFQMKVVISSVDYSLEGMWETLPEFGEKDMIDPYIKKIKMWQASVGNKNVTLWKVLWNARKLSVQVKGQEGVFETLIPETKFTAALNTTKSKGLTFGFDYKASAIDVRGEEVSKELALIGFKTTDLFPLSLNFGAFLENMPIEFVAITMVFTAEAERGQPEGAKVMYGILRLLNAFSRKAIPFKMKAGAESAVGTKVALDLKGKTNANDVLGDGTLMISNVDRILLKLDENTKSLLLEAINRKFSCDASYKMCKAKLIFSKNQVKIVPW
ncbi:MAG: hypothetical protein JRI31_07235 [Deltaproteobacteria bacterium]|nr:hypothetical protein [Deltaproteobacteria bacterium]